MKTLFISIALSTLLHSYVASGQLFILRPGQSIPVGQNIRAGNGPFTLDMQKDGNLVLYKTLTECMERVHLKRPCGRQTLMDKR